MGGVEKNKAKTRLYIRGVQKNEEREPPGSFSGTSSKALALHFLTPLSCIIKLLLHFVRPLPSINVFRCYYSWEGCKKIDPKVNYSWEVFKKNTSKSWTSNNDTSSSKKGCQNSRTANYTRQGCAELKIEHWRILIVSDFRPCVSLILLLSCHRLRGSISGPGEGVGGG